MGFFNGKTMLEDAMEDARKVREQAMTNARKSLEAAFFGAVNKTKHTDEYEVLHTIAEYVNNAR